MKTHRSLALAALLVSGLLAAIPVPVDAGLTFWGTNYCGIGNNAGGTTGKTDSACATHDGAYARLQSQNPGKIIHLRPDLTAQPDGALESALRSAAVDSSNPLKDRLKAAAVLPLWFAFQGVRIGLLPTEMAYETSFQAADAARQAADRARGSAKAAAEKAASAAEAKARAAYDRARKASDLVNAAASKIKGLISKR